MDIHKNARLTVHGRERIIRLLESGLTVKATAEIAGVDEKAVRKWRRAQ
jgi:DNA-binding CsgD family transcriptional regulator